MRQQRWLGKEALQQTAEDERVSDSVNTEDESSLDLEWLQEDMLKVFETNGVSATDLVTY